MMIKYIYLTIIVGLLVLATYLVSIAPYHIYTLTLTEGVDTRFLKMSPSPKVFYDGATYELMELTDNAFEASNVLYKDFHFNNFLIPLPIDNPVFSMIPIIRPEAMQVKLGAQFLDQKNTELFQFIFERPIKFETTNGNQEIFMLPIFSNYIKKKTQTDLWRDLFERKLSIASNGGKGFFDSLKTLNQLAYQDLVYNLFILYNREKIFEKNIQQISYDEKLHLGIIRNLEEDPLFLKEIIYFYEKGIIYPITIKTRVGSELAKYYHNKFINDLKFKNSTKDSAIPIYAEYKNIDYKQRIDQKGMVYLYSAWSHDLVNRDYVRVIVTFLERGKANIKYLKPFYEYAFKNFGSSFSNDSEFLIESNNEKLKRKMNEELESEVKKESQKESPKFEGHFSSDDEKIKYFLQKAKENKKNSDEQKKELQIE
jgi:hypothetical protein